MEKIYKTNLVYLGRNDEISLERINSLCKMEVIVTRCENGLYREILSGNEYQSIDSNSLNPDLNVGFYVIKPSEVNDRLDNTINGYKIIEAYISNKERVLDNINEFTNDEVKKDEKRQVVDEKISLFVQKESEKLLNKLKNKQKVLKK